MKKLSVSRFGFLAVALVVLAFVLASVFVSAEDANTGINTNPELANLKSSLNESKNIIVEKTAAVFHNVTGFLGSKIAWLVGGANFAGEANYKDIYVWGHYVLIGTFAAFWIFIGFALTLASFPAMKIWNFPLRVFWIWTGGSYSTLPAGSLVYTWSRNNKSLGTKKWLLRISDSWKKSLAIVVVYTIIMMVPLFNRFFQIITLEIFQPNWFIESIIVAFELGYLPAFLQEWKNRKKRVKLYKEALEEETAKKINEIPFRE